ncbi:class B sortase [Anoxynatronum buryatiense]|uniref:Sortase B. Cysteine peptidase. MEROPS family C60B n=1 Tax=Anoxynatronum buryatiense TaxID=489973 RepID=A0AA46AHX7_9CLOT|nr:class B sortase [Anoxynatronum buryatiense]SMP44102.1 sortase B. Cysteine peptidase. MEROPS family C60B [Anoxynatronum buryatiense]
MKKVIRIISIFFLIVAIIALGLRWLETLKQQTSILEAQQRFHRTQGNNEDILKEASTVLTDPSDAPKTAPVILPEIANLQSVNPQVIGWIQIPETTVDYPIVQAHDNVFYLDHDWQAEKNRAGAIFMDYRNDVSSLTRPATHTILYGHHMRDGSMFQPLISYKDPLFLQEHPVIHITDLHETHRFEIFSVYVTTTDFYYIETHFEDELAFEAFNSVLQEKSKHPFAHSITGEDALLTLSTCTYEYDDARLVVHARYLETFPRKGS